MSRKSRERMMRGRFELKTGQTTYGAALKTPAAGRLSGPLTAKKRAALLDYMAVVPADQRDELRAYLKQDGSEQATTLLTELEKLWDSSDKEKDR